MISRRAVLKGAISPVVLLAGCATGPDGSSPGGTPARSPELTDGDSDSNVWILGTPGEGLQSHIAGQAFARVLDEHSDALSLQVQSYSGSEESIRLLGRGDIDVAVASNYLGAAARTSSNPIEGVDFMGERAIDEPILQSMSYMDLRLFFVTLDDDLQTTADLAGKTVNVGPPGAAWLSIAAFDTIGILDDVELVNTNFTDVPFSLKEGRVDATLGTAALGVTPPPYIQNMREYDVSVVQYTVDHLRQLEESTVFTTGDVQIGEFFERDFDVESIPAATQNFQFWLPKSADDSLAYEFAKRSLEYASEIQNFAQFLQKFTPSYAASGLMTDVPVHPGVAKYYKDHDLWSSNLTEPE